VNKLALDMPPPAAAPAVAAAAGGAQEPGAMSGAHYGAAATAVAAIAVAGSSAPLASVGSARAGTRGSGAGAVQEGVAAAGAAAGMGVAAQEAPGSTDSESAGKKGQSPLRARPAGEKGLGSGSTPAGTATLCISSMRRACQMINSRATPRPAGDDMMSQCACEDNLPIKSMRLHAVS
jgi:hypothetical protein